jgi:hypothetical protein
VQDIYERAYSTHKMRVKFRSGDLQQALYIRGNIILKLHYNLKMLILLKYLKITKV